MVHALKTDGDSATQATSGKFENVGSHPRHPLAAVEDAMEALGLFQLEIRPPQHHRCRHADGRERGGHTSCPGTPMNRSRNCAVCRKPLFRFFVPLLKLSLLANDLAVELDEILHGRVELRERLRELL